MNEAPLFHSNYNLFWEIPYVMLKCVRYKEMWLDMNVYIGTTTLSRSDAVIPLLIYFTVLIVRSV